MGRTPGASPLPDGAGAPRPGPAAPLAHGQPALHRLVQSATLVANLIEQMSGVPARSAEHARLMTALHTAAGALLHDTEVLRATLYAP